MNSKNSLVNIDEAFSREGSFKKKEDREGSFSGNLLTVPSEINREPSTNDDKAIVDSPTPAKKEYQGVDKLSGHELLMNLIKKNVGEVKLTAEQKALHDAYHTLLEEYKRRKKVRQKTGIIFGRTTQRIKEMIKVKNLWSGGKGGKEMMANYVKMVPKKESDLQLKSRSQFLQKRRANEKRRGSAVVNYNEADRI